MTSSVMANTSQCLASARRILLQKPSDDLSGERFASHGRSARLFRR